LRSKFPGLSEDEACLGKKIDSMQLVELVNEIEAEFGIEIHSIEIDDKNFCDLDSIVALVESKLRHAAV
jgi:acyl carrier protein